MPPYPQPRSAPPVIVIMGVAGSGKTSIGEMLAARLGVPFRDADEFHPASNRAKMAAGTPLTDDDRWPWLDAIGRALHDANASLVVTCSALKRAYRDRLRQAAARRVVFVYLTGSRATIAARMTGRRGHFMPPSLLDSQFATLEPPDPDEQAITVSVEPPLDAVVAAILAALPAIQAPND
jgi:gluconokinase